MTLLHSVPILVFEIEGGGVILDFDWNFQLNKNKNGSWVKKSHSWIDSNVNIIITGKYKNKYDGPNYYSVWTNEVNALNIINNTKQMLKNLIILLYILL